MYFAATNMKPEIATYVNDTGGIIFRSDEKSLIP